MKPARNPYSFDEALERAGLLPWPKICDRPEEDPLRRYGYGVWMMVAKFHQVSGVPEAALLAVERAELPIRAIHSARRLGGAEAVIALLEPYVREVLDENRRKEGDVRRDADGGFGARE